MKLFGPRKRGFTLIELLIVIAIILILIAIALPNFLEAQIRARVTKVKGDLRTIGIAMEMYIQDFKQYPPDHDPSVNNRQENGLYQLTSPIAYMASLPQDAFNTSDGVSQAGEYEFEMASSGLPINAIIPPGPLGARTRVQTFNVHSHGPSTTDNFNGNDAWPFGNLTNPCGSGDGWMSYAATNGSKSFGILYQLGGEHRSGAYCIDGWHAVLGFYPPHR